MKERSGPAKWGGVAGITGGLLFIVVGVLFTTAWGSMQVRILLFRVAGLLVALALVGFYAHQSEGRGCLRRVGWYLALVAAGAGVLTIPMVALVPDLGNLLQWLVSMGEVVSTLGSTISLVFLGLIALRRKAFWRWRALPLVIGLGSFLLISAGALMESAVPFILYGLGWVLLGFAVRSPREA